MEDYTQKRQEIEEEIQCWKSLHVKPEMDEKSEAEFWKSHAATLKVASDYWVEAYKAQVARGDAWKREHDKLAGQVRRLKRIVEVYQSRQKS